MEASHTFFSLGIVALGGLLCLAVVVGLVVVIVVAMQKRDRRD